LHISKSFNNWDIGASIVHTKKGLCTSKCAAPKRTVQRWSR